MKKLIVVILAVVAGAVLANDPGEAFEILVDAVFEGDAEGVHKCLSTESVAMIEMMLVMVKMQPGSAAAEMSRELGVDISEEELLGWTAIDLIDMLLSAPGFTDALPPREDIVVSGFELSGDTSIVFVMISEYPEPFEIAMIMDGENWKLDKSLIQSEL